MTPKDQVSVLVVEDEILIALRMCGDLEKAGYSVYEPVATGAEAIACVQENPPSVILMDIRLPGEMNGIQAAQTIGAAYDIPIIFITGYSDLETITRAQQVNPVAILEKPLFAYQLNAAIQDALK